ncbi:NAD-dependent epimerase/dehydratase family protein [Nonomuraea sp. NN258]|uniref:NAD-dependent epimerase/dehydratase family protein n=1 Tax=Nonomuraea antri TaxID=2730852 RepID=UPI001568FC86|nr:NAD-dependent epimerase/dehydratase family protein [Nonomuraea antri]NRQ38798.1 NAD-dependent epimerase/dehydratase family protein [Nonomuraea antri]
MRILVLGGTRFVGRVMVEQAITAGHRVTTLNRGLTGSDVPGAEAIRGDRENINDLGRLVTGREWDWVIDTSGYVPAVVGQAARSLAGQAGAYLFLSTISVYPGWPEEAVSESSTTYDCDTAIEDTAEEEATWSAAQYGSYKAGCEQAVLQGFDGAVTILRPGVILGPQENVGRLTWWLNRINRGGEILAPGPPDRPIQPIDIRDLATFALHCLATTTTGVFNTVAPQGRTTFAAMLSACAAAVGVSCELAWVKDEFLLRHGVRQWTELPLWRTHPGTWRVDATRAHDAGLRCRRLQKTVHDTWEWMLKEGGPPANARQDQHGLSPEKERQLLVESKQSVTRTLERPGA